MRNLISAALLAGVTALHASAGEISRTAEPVYSRPSFAFDSGPDVEQQNAEALFENTHRETRGKRAGPTESYNDSVCVTMRTYRVARLDRDSDATSLVGYSRCQPAWKFQLRTAEQGVGDPPQRRSGSGQ